MRSRGDGRGLRVKEEKMTKIQYIVMKLKDKIKTLSAMITLKQASKTIHDHTDILQYPFLYFVRSQETGFFQLS